MPTNTHDDHMNPGMPPQILDTRHSFQEYTMRDGGIHAGDHTSFAQQFISTNPVVPHGPITDYQLSASATADFYYQGNTGGHHSQQPTPSINGMPAPEFKYPQKTSNLPYSSKVINTEDNSIYRIADNQKVMEHRVRQFYSEDGSSFIEHVPGHCLVFIPNAMNIDYVVQELRKVRKSRVTRKSKGGIGKPTNAFIKYRKYMINKLKRSHPEISQVEISKMAAEYWKKEDEEIKESFRQEYREDKKRYETSKQYTDVSKPSNTKSIKRSRTETDSASDTEARTMFQQSMNITGSHPSSNYNDATANGSGAGFGLGLGFNYPSSGTPAGFNPNRRRSHTLPPGGFPRIGSKRRISQELRKHLANKTGAAYITAAAAAAAAAAIGTPEQEMVDSTSSIDLSFESPMMGASVSNSLSNSPYLNSSVSPLMIPLNPSFPMSDFTNTLPPVVSSAQMAASTGIFTGATNTANTTPVLADNVSLTIDTSPFTVSGNDLEAFTPDQEDLANCWVNTNLSASLATIATPSENSTLAGFNTGSVPFSSPFGLASTSGSEMLTSEYSAIAQNALVASTGVEFASTQAVSLPVTTSWTLNQAFPLANGNISDNQ